MLSGKTFRWRRIGAFLIDMAIAMTPFLIYDAAFGWKSLFLIYPTMDDALYIMVGFLFSMWCPLSLIFRDVMMKGRSIGKRVFGLITVRAVDGTPAPTGIKILRGLLVYIFFIDVFMLLITGRSLTDRITRTTVVKIP